MSARQTGSPAWALSWPAELETLRRAIELREAEATFAVCDPLRRERLRLEIQVLSARLETMKVALMAREVAA